MLWRGAPLKITQELDLIGLLRDRADPPTHRPRYAWRCYPPPNGVSIPLPACVRENDYAMEWSARSGSNRRHSAWEADARDHWPLCAKGLRRPQNLLGRGCNGLRAQARTSLHDLPLCAAPGHAIGQSPRLVRDRHEGAHVAPCAQRFHPSTPAPPKGQGATLRPMAGRGEPSTAMPAGG
jgi:hypothetical protein